MPPGRPIEFTWSLVVPTDVERTWAVMADTDAFNRIVESNLTFRDEQRPDGSTVIVASTRRAGITVEWVEEPFEVHAPVWFAQTRQPRAGPLSSARSTCRLTAVPEGTRIDYGLTLVPRHWLFRPILILDALLGLRPGLQRALDRVVATLTEGARLADPAPPLPAPVDALLHDRLAGVEPPELAAEIARIVREAPPTQQDRIAPLAVGRALGLPDDTTVAGFLQAVRAGALELRWELLCPSCRAPRVAASALDLAARDIHCPSCDVRYDGTFADAVAVVFRPAAEVRRLDVRTECMLSPGRTPHIMARRPIASGGEDEWTSRLDEGGYRLDTWPRGPVATVEVRPELHSRAVTVDLTPGGFVPPVLRVGPGPVRFAIRNRTSADVAVIVERRARPPGTLTAGRLLDHPDATDLLPADAIAPGLDVHVRRGAVVAVSGLDPEDADRAAVALRDRAPVCLGQDGARVVAMFDTFADALDAAGLLDGDPSLAAGLAVGPVALVSDATDTQPMGQAVDDALAAMRALGAGHTGLPTAALSLPDVTAALAAREGLVRVPPTRGQVTVVRFLRERPVQPSPPPGTPAVAGLTVHEALDRGGMGIVYAATDATGAAVVVKVMHPDLAAVPEHVQRFYNEARLTGRLDHANVVRVHDYGTTQDGRLYLVMERLVGRQLEDALADGPLDVGRSTAIGLGVLDGLAAAHDAGIVHRDVKPGNIFLSVEDGREVPRLIDFGIALEAGEHDELALRGQVIGTPSHVAPEQLRLQVLDGRTDLYALGLVLYQCAAGELPFRGTTPAELALDRLQRDPAPLDALAPDLPPTYAPAVMRAIARDRDARWPDARAMSAALRS